MTGPASAASGCVVAPTRSARWLSEYLSSPATACSSMQNRS